MGKLKLIFNDGKEAVEYTKEYYSIGQKVFAEKYQKLYTVTNLIIKLDETVYICEEVVI